MPNISEIPVQFVKGVGPAKAKLLANLGIHTVEDLLYHFPYRHEDRSRFTPIAMLNPGETQTVSGKILAVAPRNFYSRHKNVEISVADKSGRVFCVWFNQPWLDKYFKAEQEIVLHGRVGVYKKRLQMVVPDFELIAEEDRTLNMGRIVPVYPLTKGITQRFMRKVIHEALENNIGQIRDVIPAAVRQRQGLESIAKSIRQVHFPNDEQAREQAGQRAAFEEFFLFQVCVLLRRLSMTTKKGIAHPLPETFMGEYAGSFPFSLTKSQRKAAEEVAQDMAKARPMLRLLQGDVGCGKTVVAFFGCAAAFHNGRQSVIMAPTEILAQQHYANFQKLLDRPVFKGMRCSLLTSVMPKKDKERITQGLKEGSIDVIVGTHALLEENVVFKDLSFVVIDEQHKFGVSQRALLSAKGSNPDVLVMTATPIPRTLCLTLYGDLDVSVIDEMPPGRGVVKTYCFAEDKSAGVYEKVRQWVQKGTQTYIIYPMVDESETLDLKAATDMFNHFVKFEFKDLRLALVHGQMAKKQVEETMLKFKNHEIDILVATTILEVGIDVPNANVMVIEHAERFGLSQLHQMRGRIGRGVQDGVCILIANPTTTEAKSRLDAIIQTTDGFKIAEYDLEIRGPGHYFGRHQHGENEIRTANPLTQMAVLEKARSEAIEITRLDPQLNGKDHALIKSIIKKRYPQYLETVLAG